MGDGWSGKGEKLWTCRERREEEERRNERETGAGAVNAAGEREETKKRIGIIVYGEERLTARVFYGETYPPTPSSASDC